MRRVPDHRARVLSAVLALLALPLLVALTEATIFFFDQRNSHSLVSGGEHREYLLHVPEGHEPERPTPLVLSFHGAGGWAALHRDVTRWNEVADEHGFLVAYPAALGGDLRTRVWRTRPGAGLEKDVRFVAALIDDIAASHRLDRERIYVNGLSNGAGMSFALSCTLPERIAAVGLVASAQTLPWEWCPRPAPVPMISFHGTADPVTPFEGGTSWIGPVDFPSAPHWAERWARRNGCQSTVTEQPAPDVTRRRFADCRSGAPVVFVALHGGGHTWPGGLVLPEWFLGTTSDSVDASREMWNFFQQFRLEETKRRH